MIEIKKEKRKYVKKKECRSNPSFSPEFQKEVDDFFKSLITLLKKSPLPTKGAIISFMRMYRSKSERWIAQQLDISPSSLNIMKKREEKNKCTMHTLKKIAYVLNCDLFYCFIPKEIKNPFSKNELENKETDG